MARPGRPERNRAAQSFRQLRRFHHVINSDKVFGTHSRPTGFFSAGAVFLAASHYVHKPIVAGNDLHTSRPILISIATGPARLKRILKLMSRPYESSDMISWSTVVL